MLVASCGGRNLPVGFASTHEQRQPGRTQGHDRKPQLEAQRRDRVRTVGASLHPWGLTGCRYASERGEPTGRSATPSPRPLRTACHPINDTREASRLSDLSPHRGALQPAQRRPEAGRNALGLTRYASEKRASLGPKYLATWGTAPGRLYRNSAATCFIDRYSQRGHAAGE